MHVMDHTCTFCHPTDSVKALKETQSNDPNQWPRLFHFFIYYWTLVVKMLVLSHSERVSEQLLNIPLDT